MKLRTLTIALALGLGLWSCGSGDKPSGDADHGKTDSTMTSASEEDTTANMGDKEVYTADVEASELIWKGTKKIGDGHAGTIKLSSGTLEVAEDKIVGGEFVVDMTSLETTDFEEGDEKKGKLEGHLKSDDFFNAEKYPEAKLVIASLENDTLKGDLTIRDKTNPVAIPVSVSMEGDSLMGQGTLVIDRTAFDVKYGSGNIFKELTQDKIINDEMELEIKLKAAK